jgi:plasmid stability protein
MASLHVRNLDDDLVRKLKIRAAQNGRSAEAEHREILKRALSEGTTEERKKAFIEIATKLRAETAGRKHTPSEILQRESRDEAR